jgi:hypothetical protein
MADEGAAAGPPGPRKSETGPDIQQLADKVYRLLLAEARLDRARSGAGAPRARG